MSSEDNKRVAKNAIALTLRMVLATIVGLYTSRVVLEVLGVDDYGIYGVIGGVVGMFSFLNSSMAGATSRFITFELGRGNTDKLRKIFSCALIIHVIIALIVAVLAETIGLWFINNRMNFPTDRMFAVNVLYQFTILSMFITFTQVPYTAAIIAHERMSIYAYLEILNVVLKLLIVYLLLIVRTDRLILYAVLTFSVSVISAMIYRYYCIRHFHESHFHWVWDKSIVREMLTFSGYDIYGNMCSIVGLQSRPIIINIFFGVVANAGASIASTVVGTIAGLTSSISQAFRPQIIKMYANNLIGDMSIMMRRSVQFTLLAYSIIGLPVYIEAESILFIWLGQVPVYSVEFIRLIIISSLFGIVITTNNAAIHSTGNIKNISFISGTLYLISPFVTYFVLKYWIKDVTVVYVVHIIFLVQITLLGWLFVRLQIPEFKIGNYAKYIIRSWFSIILSFIIFIFIKSIVMPDISDYSLIKRLIIIAIETIAGGLIIFTFTAIVALSHSEVIYIRDFVLKKLRIQKI